MDGGVALIDLATAFTNSSDWLTTYGAVSTAALLLDISQSRENQNALAEIISARIAYTALV